MVLFGSMSNSFRKAKRMFSTSPAKEHSTSNNLALPDPGIEKKQFTEPEKIRVPALYNEQQIKKRKSFVVEADVIIQEGDLYGATAANDPSRKIGCLLKPQQSMRDMMSPGVQGVQTWHKKTNMTQSAPSLTRNGYSAPLPHKQQGVRNAFALEQAMEALEEVEEEMKDLKQVIQDSEDYGDNPALQKAMARMASQKKQTLQSKLNFIVFEGEDSEVFQQLKNKLQKALTCMSIDWSSGGLDLTPGQAAKGPKVFNMGAGSVFSQGSRAASERALGMTRERSSHF